MCKIIVVINKNKENESTISDIINANVSKLEQEKDGYSLYRSTDNTTSNYLRLAAYENMQKNIQYEGEKVYILHTRTSTAGSEGIDGLHLQTLLNNWVFAHNGVVSQYSGVKKKSDSYYYFKHLLSFYNEKIDENILSVFNGKAGFSGKGVLYNNKKDLLYFFCNMKAYVTLLKDTIIISSFELNTEKKSFITHSVMGYKWTEYKGKEDIKGIIHKEDIDDCMIEIKKGLVTKKVDIERVYNNITTYPDHTRQHWDQQQQKWVSDDDDDTIYSNALYKSLKDDVMMMKKKGMSTLEIRQELQGLGYDENIITALITDSVMETIKEKPNFSGKQITIVT